MTDVGLGEVLVTAAVASIWVLIPALAIALGLRLAGVGRGRKPEDVLRGRFARGEISQADFKAAMAALGR